MLVGASCFNDYVAKKSPKQVSESWMILFRNKIKQAGTELSQAQVMLGLARLDLLSKKLGSSSFE